MIDLFKTIGILSLFLFQSFVIWIYLLHFFVVRIPKMRFYCFIFCIYFVGRTSITVDHTTFIDLKIFSLFCTFLILFFFLSGEVKKYFISYFWLFGSWFKRILQVYYLIIRQKLKYLLFFSFNFYWCCWLFSSYWDWSVSK